MFKEFGGWGKPTRKLWSCVANTKSQTFSSETCALGAGASAGGGVNVFKLFIFKIIISHAHLFEQCLYFNIEIKKPCLLEDTVFGVLLFMQV